MTDFGIAQPEDATRLTSTGLVVGTRSYLAPEVLSGEPATARSDLYSCGIVLQEAYGEMLPTDLAALVRRLSEQDPVRRPETASTALASLTGSQSPPRPADGPTTSTVARPAERATPTLPVGATAARTRDRRWLLGGLALLAGLLVVGTFLFSGGDEASSPEGNPGSDVRSGDRAQREQARAAESEGPPATKSAPPPQPPGVPDSPPGKTKKVKPPKPHKSPPGKAKGHRKH